MRQQLQHVGSFQCQTTCRRPGIGVRQMKEDGAAAAPHAGPKIEIEHQYDVIGVIVTPHRLMASRIWTTDRPVVVGVGRVVAPAVVGSQGLKGNAGARPDTEPIRPVEATDDAKMAQRTRSITFPFQRRQTRSADGRRHVHPATDKSPMRRVGRSHANVKACERRPLRFQLAVHIFRLA